MQLYFRRKSHFYNKVSLLDEQNGVNLPVKILFDSNFLMIQAQFRINISKELEKLLNRRKIMTKSQLLKRIHEMITKDDDIMEQETLFELQEIIDREIILEYDKGNLQVELTDDGYIKKVIAERRR